MLNQELNKAALEAANIAYFRQYLVGGALTPAETMECIKKTIIAYLRAINLK